jgi:hypothetical protein
MSEPIPVGSTNLSHAWAMALLQVAKGPLNNPPPLVVSITGFDKENLPLEDVRVRQALDTELIARNRNSVEVSSLVVFPYKAWDRRGRPSCEEFSQWCLEKYVPRLKALNKKDNSRGLYFERMMRFPYRDSQGRLHSHNQLKYVIDWWREHRGTSGSRPRRSGLQMSCFDPREDHNRLPRLAFPCLQQVGLSYDPRDKDSLILNAFYPTQFLLDRAYGNYLGLCHLGAFLSHQIGVKLIRMNCFVGCAQLGNGVKKEQIKPLLELLEGIVPT